MDTPECGADPVRRVEVRVEGVVQGVGFRPFVHGLAQRLALSGHVGNDTAGVVIEAEGPREAVSDFLKALRSDTPPLAAIHELSVVELVPRGGRGFRILDSDGSGRRRTLISADSATCEACLRELFDPRDRRYRYPFVNCTDCGPRFTIVRDIPYDRPNTTMAGFPLCGACSREYHDPSDRRFHAQPVCCPECGPQLRIIDAHGRPLGEDPISRAVELLRAGMIVAVKGLGGYHLAADAVSRDAAATLRARKHREDKPFAVMVATLAVAKRLCYVDERAERALAGRRRPVVLLDRRDAGGAGAPVSDAVAPGTRRLGIMLPYTPLHHLLMRKLATPIVLTSGNVSDEPIAFTDDDALARLAGIADAFLVHDRPIHVRADDSVVTTWRGRVIPVRRSRGYAPEPIACPHEFPRPVLACGAELKNTVCLAAGRRAVLSAHIGDLKNAETLLSFTESIEHLCRLFDITPEVVAHDLHPDYASTRYALEETGLDAIGVQHHHAHVAACLADNGVDGPAIGVAFDGTGYGTDGTVWGGEFLLATCATFERAGHLATVPMPGGEAAVRQPWRMAAAYLRADSRAGDLAVAQRQGDRWEQVRKLVDSRVNTPATSSAGRLFDAVAAVLGVRDTVTYEGQAAIELEQRADPHHPDGYHAGVTDIGGTLVVDSAALVGAVVDDHRRGVDPALVAARFHNGLADVIRRTCQEIAERTGIRLVALSGGVFANRLLLGRTVDALERHGFTVLTHGHVPCNDGGIGFGQAVVVGARDRAAR
ncbi:carbamoyltransferase HypF [Saccharomonospora xinjiangensis]|uniref:carbamoyltransferase HypF n=1 Tax=Saccharomonospora xinjiangensis TaxID=75294 RepID=UPI0010702F6F|nr:carbamoyltransferase HypF [Saccharomonospora xinjiangensis]QBQ59240.1 Carbamoyltransferase HypF [Saccharomonospora xinjiangensis]